MSWLPIIALAVIAFVAAVFVLKLDRGSWTLLGAALMFGLAGYALQGSPGMAGSPKSVSVPDAESGEMLVSARREFYGTDQLPSRWVLTGDGFLRRGDYARAAGFYNNAVQDDPRDAEAWSALGISLIEHAEGNLTPAAIESLARAESLDEENAAPRYFLGLAWLRAGEPVRTLELWDEAISNAPQDAEWRESLVIRRQNLVELLTRLTADRQAVE